MPHARCTRVPSRLAVVVALVAVALAAVSGLATPAHAQATTFFVAPNGADTNAGTSATLPFKTLQRALDAVQVAGTTINLAAGVYKEAVATKFAGTAAAPITIKGPETGKAVGGRYRAVLYGLGGRVFSINHSYYTLDGFTIDGQPEALSRANLPTSLAAVRDYKDGIQTANEGQPAAFNSKLVYVGAANDSHDIVGTTISNMFLARSGGECVRFRNRAANSLVVNSVIQYCGMRGLGVEPGQYKYHNAEGVYIGTSPKSADQPMAADDASNNIVVRDSTIDTFGSECFEVKENAHHNRMENVDCGFNDEPLANQGSNVELRGDHNTVLRSRLYESRSWNMKLASDTAADDLGGNTAQITDFKRAGVNVTGGAPAIVNRQTGSGPFCSDTFDSTISTGNSVGNPTAACAGVDTTAPTVTARTPAATTGAATSTNVTATFSEAVQPTTVTDATFTLKAGTTTVTAPVSYDAATRTATLNPAVDLAANTQYTATLTGGASGIKDTAGNPLVTSTWTFTTAAAAQTDTTAPTVTTRTPAANATGVAVGGNVTATFSEAVQSAGVTAANFKLRAAGASVDVAAAVTYNATTRVATLDPTANLSGGTAYTATLTGGASGIKDTAGNPLVNDSWTFTTAAAPADTTRPTVTSRLPSSGATNVSRSGSIRVTFSEAVNNVNTTTVVLRRGTSPTSSPVLATVSLTGTNQWTLDPTPTTLDRQTTYTVYLTNGITDAAGNQLTATSWRFTTGR